MPILDNTFLIPYGLLIRFAVSFHGLCGLMTMCCWTARIHIAKRGTKAACYFSHSDLYCCICCYQLSYAPSNPHQFHGFFIRPIVLYLSESVVQKYCLWRCHRRACNRIFISFFPSDFASQAKGLQKPARQCSLQSESFRALYPALHVTSYLDIRVYQPLRPKAFA